MIEIHQWNDDQQSRVEAFCNRLFSMAASSIELATVPIAHIDNDRLIEIRSGVLLQIDQMKLLVTAGHGLVDHLNAGRPPYIVMSKEKLHPIALIHEHFWTTNDASVDLAVAQLHDSTVAYLSDQYRYLRLTAMMSKNDRRHDRSFYVLAGYPSARIETDEQQIDCAHNWKYLTYRFTGDYSEVTNYNPDLHLILRYERGSRSTEGKIIQPRGLSGCGVWSVGDPLCSKLLTPDDLRLVAIQTAWHKGVEYCKCTWIDSVLKIIWEYYPAARGPMRVHGMFF